ncbi:MAG: transcription-repair coupling factor [Planctomycetia bacterium]|nr:transcription-repair coupling factor [Planctomycetia bacterium]
MDKITMPADDLSAVCPLVAELKSRMLKNDSMAPALSRLSQGESVCIDGLQGSAGALLGATLLDELRRRHEKQILLVVAPTAGEVDALAENFALFSQLPLEVFPLLPEVLSQKENEFFVPEDVPYGTRLRCIKNLSGNLSGEPSMAILVTSVPALLAPVPGRQDIADNTLSIVVGHEVDRESLLSWLTAFGFASTSAVTLPGEFSVRGDLVDIFPCDRKEPVRVEFFGDTVESIRPFEIASQRSTGSLDRLDLCRLRLFSHVSGTFTEHLPKETTVFLADTPRVMREIQRLIAAPRPGTANRPETSQSAADVMNALYRFPTIHAVPFADGTEVASLRFSLNTQSVDRFRGNIQDVFTQEQNLDPASKVYLFCQTQGEKNRLDEVLSATPVAKRKKLITTVGRLSEGFQWPDENLMVLSTVQIFGRLARGPARPRTMSKTIDSFLDLTPGDLVIHVGHGLARFRGLKTIKKAQLEEEHLELEFADKVSLYVPTSKIHLVQKYVGSGKKNPRLAKINGTLWLKQKKEVQEAVFSLAAEMLDVAAARNALEGIAFPADTPWQSDFETSFPFCETDDQLAAIEAIKRDMEGTRPMDRLLCGDVGFGKTEVAMRAAFKAVAANHQVAVLVPTTVLAEQHYRVFRDRMSTFPVSIEVLSRFTTAREKRSILDRLASGKLDIVIGTHALTRSDIPFARLGLVVIDEEQKFGVSDKEQLKKIRNLVDVLTMTATPIPRTLHFSLVGLRDISNLEHAPENRLPVKTQIIRYDEDFIRKAILRELNRNGQVYYVHNRVSDIESVAAKLREIVPEARIGVGHAQMSNEELEDVMRNFVLRKYDVLLCTTIIESGFDIPNANTIFIDRADRFGLAELHQLRGRVGRDRYQAWCYLLLGRHQVLTPDASKRLAAISEYSHLGAGFQIAMRDLEIRGAGNILGTQQSGHIATVGYEMYCDFLDSAVRALKKEPPRIAIEMEIDLPGVAVIPHSYIADQRAKIDVYRRLLRAVTLEECNDMRTELVDRFGPCPPEVTRLLLFSRIRVCAYRWRVRSIRLANETGTPYLLVKFHVTELMYRLRDLLKPHQVPLRPTDEQTAYIPVPPSYIAKDPNDPNVVLSEFVYHIFSLEQPS